MPSEELPATCACLAPLLAARSAAVRFHALLLICRAVGTAAGQGVSGVSGAASGAPTTEAAEKAVAAAEMSDAELAEVIPPPLLRLLEDEVLTHICCTIYTTPMIHTYIHISRWCADHLHASCTCNHTC